MITFKKFASIEIRRFLDFLVDAVFRITMKDGTTAVIPVGDIANMLDASTRLVSLTAASSMTREANGNGKINLLSLLAGFDTTLPEATGSGDTYEFMVGIVNTTGDYGLLALTTDTLSGSALILDSDTSDNVVGFLADGTDDKMEINGTTKGGLTIGDKIKFTDVAATTWAVEATLTGSGIVVTPFAAT